ncbi:hypothetical protein LUZ60_001243 [Juncus effusus]|nr:hypothetical protein LUZ60_001243 [Juncus effusus]
MKSSPLLTSPSTPSSSSYSTRVSMASHVSSLSFSVRAAVSSNGGPRAAGLKGFFGGAKSNWSNLVMKNSQRYLGNSSRFFCSIASSSFGGESFSQPTLNDETSNSSFVWPDKKRPRVCILGGGFGGLYTALRLESLFWPDDNKPQVVLVDQSDKFVFKPMLYELLTGEVDAWEIAPQFTDLLKNTSIQFVKDKVKLLNPSDHLRGVKKDKSSSAGTVYLQSGTSIEYDWLVLALGAETKLDLVPGSADFAIPFSTLEDALRVDKELKRLETERSEKIKVAIVGLGYAGVELAATISERLQGNGMVYAINSAPIICPLAPPGNREAALKVLELRNIQLFLGYFVKCIKEASSENLKRYVLELQPAQRGAKSEVLEVDLVLWTVGATSAISRLQPQEQIPAIPLNGRGQVETEETLRVKGHFRTFAIGDSAALRDPSGKLLPSTAQVAFQQADFAGWNLWAAINDRPLLPFRFQNLGEMMILGKNDAAVTPSFIEGLTLDGPIGHAARKFAYLLRLPTDEHRVKVGFSWFTKTAVDSASSLQSTLSSLLNPKP